MLNDQILKIYQFTESNTVSNYQGEKKSEVQIEEQELSSWNQEYLSESHLFCVISLSAASHLPHSDKK